jgi:hypothetical protein
MRRSFQNSIMILGRLLYGVSYCSTGTTGSKI